VAAIWGASFMFIEIALEDLEPRAGDERQAGVVVENSVGGNDWPYYAHPISYLVALELDGRTTRSRVFLGAPLSESDVRTVAGDAIQESVDVRWDERRGDVVAERAERFGSIALSVAPVPTDAVEAERFRTALLDGLRTEGLDLLAWNDDLRELQARLGFLHHHRPDDWPAVDDHTLLSSAEERIGPYLEGIRRRRDLRSVDVRSILLDGLGWDQRERIDHLAPRRLPVPSGNHHRVDYTVDPPVLAVKLQELFGTTETPAVLDGAVPVVLHLLSPAGRPLQVTQDLGSFWADGYAQVRSEMRGRYPKHPWPGDPTTAVPTSRTTRRSEQS
jgi:ATP-dependent helicase HrpB